MAKRQRIAENINIQQLANILLLLISIQLCIYHYPHFVWEGKTTLELSTDVDEFFVDALFLEFSCAGISQVGYKRCEASHG